MDTLGKKIFHFAVFALIGVAVLSSCETDLKEVDRIAAIQAEEPVDISLGVTVIYSDSAMVKAEVTAPEMRYYNVEEPYYEFQQGITIVFYDENNVETQRITSDYAIQKEAEELTEFRRNVVITRADGTVIKTEELIHDQKENTFYNHVTITASFSGGGNLQGDYFRSNGDFTDIYIHNSTALHYLEQGQGPSF